MNCDPITNNIQFIKGDDYAYKVTVSDQTVTPTVPLNITGYTFYFTVKTNFTDADASSIFQKIVTTHLDAVNGTTLISINSADTINTPVGEYYYDIAWKTAGNKNRTIVRGKFILDYHVTFAA